MPTPPKLYLLTNEDPIDLLLTKLKIVLETKSVSVLQIRRKQHEGNEEALRLDIEKIINLASSYDVTIIINDFVHLAKEFNTGVHIGREDTELQMAREILGQQAMIGKTCYHSLAFVNEAIDHKASYVAMGAVFPSKTKPLARQISVDKIVEGSKLARRRDNKLCIIGGIRSDNIALLRGVDIAYIAITADILGQPMTKITNKCLQWQLQLDNWYCSSPDN